MKSRFAPSPTGLLHLGNIYSALQCDFWTKKNAASLVLRIEDIDFTRCKPELSQAIINDLNWMGLRFDGEVVYQSQRTDFYQKALDKLISMDVLYPCFCTRKQVAENTLNPNPEQLDTYPRTCLALSESERSSCMKEKAFSWRLDSQKVQALLGDDLFWLDGNLEKQVFSLTQNIGDVIIGRKDIKFSYHLAVVVDDAEQGITHVIRGVDLRSSTPVHRTLQLLLGYEPPAYIHHDLIEDKHGTRLAKSKGSTTLQSLRKQGVSPDKVRESLKLS